MTRGNGTQDGGLVYQPPVFCRPPSRVAEVGVQPVFNELAVLRSNEVARHRFRSSCNDDRLLVRFETRRLANRLPGLSGVCCCEYFLGAANCRQEGPSGASEIAHAETVAGKLALANANCGR